MPKVDNKHYTYTIWHLQHSRLLKAEASVRAGDSTEEEKLAASLFEKLISNHQRKDMHSKKYYDKGEKDYHFAEIDERKLNQEKTKRKARAAKELMKMGYYEKVASCVADNAQEAVMMTTNIDNENWVAHALTSKGKKVVGVHNVDARTTSSYDIIESFGRLYLNMPLGKINIQEERYATRLV